MILTFLIISIVLGIVFTLGIRKKLFTWQHHKSPKAFIRTFQVFFIVIIFFMIVLSFSSSNVYYYNHILFYAIVDKLSDLYPVFVLNVLFYLLLRKEFGKHENSTMKQLFLGFVIIIVPYFMWLTTLLFIQNYWIFINYGAISGFIFGMLLILGIFNLGQLIRTKIKSDLIIGIILILIGTPLIVYVIIFFMMMEFIPYLILNFVILMILTVISYAGLHMEFFQKGNKTQMLGKMNKIEYSYYILLGFFFIAFFIGLETLFNSAGVITNGLFITSSTVNLFFIIGFIVGLFLTFIIKRSSVREQEN